MKTPTRHIKMNTCLFGLCIGILLFLLQACKEAPEPRLDEILPREGQVGQIVSVKGAFLGYRNGLFFGNLQVDGEVVSGGNDQIRFRVPEGAEAGEVEVYILTDEGKSRSVLFRVLPSIRAIEPLQAAVGEEVTITTNFPGQDIEVLFSGNVVAPITSTNNEKYTLRVPEGAVSGPLTIKLTEGTIFTTEDFIVEAAPVITSLEPNQGWPGRVLKVRGDNFSEEETSVFFSGGVAAAINFISFSSLDVEVPEGAQTGALVLETPYGVDTTAFELIPSPTDLPFISKLSSSVISGGCTIDLIGGNFDLQNTSVTFPSITGGEILVRREAFDISRTRDTLLSIPVPENAVTGQITVSTGNGSSEGIDLQIVARPSLIRTLPRKNAQGGQLVLEVKDGQLVERILIGDKVILPDNNAFEYVNYGAGGEIIATNVPTTFPQSQTLLEVPVRMEMAKGCESNSLNFEVGTTQTSPNAPLSGGAHTVIIPSGTAGLPFINNDWITAEGDFTDEESIDLGNDQYSISFCGCRAPNGDVLLYSLFERGVGCEDPEPRPCSDYPVFLGEKPVGRIKPDGSFVAIKSNFYEFVGRFDDSYAQFGTASMVMSPVDSGDQTVFTRPGFITEASRLTAQVGDEITLKGRMNLLDDLFIKANTDSVRIQDIQGNLKEISFQIPSIPGDTMPLEASIYFYNSNDELVSNRISIDLLPK